MSLTPRIAERILSFIRAGAFDYVAAEAAGVSARTFRDWIARGEGTHPTRPSTPKLRRFAAEVRTTKAEARISAEVRVHQDRPVQWLSRVARSRPEREGWTDAGSPAAQEREENDILTKRIVAYHERQQQREAEARAAAEAGHPVPSPHEPGLQDYGDLQ